MFHYFTGFHRSSLSPDFFSYWNHIFSLIHDMKKWKTSFIDSTYIVCPSHRPYLNIIFWIIWTDRKMCKFLPIPAKNDQKKWHNLDQNWWLIQRCSKIARRNLSYPLHCQKMDHKMSLTIATEINDVIIGVFERKKISDMASEI